MPQMFDNVYILFSLFLGSSYIHLRVHILLNVENLGRFYFSCLNKLALLVLATFIISNRKPSKSNIV